MLNLRALQAFLWSLFLTPALALAQSAEPVQPPYTPPQEATRWGLGWLWLAVLAVILIALVAWGLSRDRTHQGPPLPH
jgi:heme/copper-type cytochrome/quinol oxidase subunit 2